MSNAMSFFSKIESVAHTFAGWVAKEWSKLYSEEPKFEPVIDAALKYVGGALQLIVSVEASPAAGDVVGKVIAEARSDLAAASGLIYDFGASPTVGSILAGIATNLSALLAAGHIKSQSGQSIAARIITELQAIATALLPEPAPAA